MDENGVVIKNKARLVAQAYMGFMLYQMDVKSAFFNGKISEEVYVQQLRGFQSSEFPNHVCKLDKALYGLKQAPKAWYDTLSIFLIQHKFVRDFKGISIFQEKYVKDLLKKYDLADSTSVKYPMLPLNNLGTDESGVSINETLFRGMIGSLMYLTASRLDIQFSTCLCARYQANPKESHLIAVKRIFRYLKGTPNLDLWYPKGLIFDLKAYYNSDYAGCNLDRKSTSRGCQILGGKLSSGSRVSWMIMMFSMTRYHFIRDHILKEDIELHFVPTNLQLADIFTKPIVEPSFTRLVAELGNLNVTTKFKDKLMTLNKVTFIASFIPLIKEYLMKVNKKARILELKRRNMKKTDFDI
ncbi:retrovirus-related pol polyprotein from transposon TNT 1-94 [Tanacetum coccineum]